MKIGAALDNAEIHDRPTPRIRNAIFETPGAEVATADTGLSRRAGYGMVSTSTRSPVLIGPATSTRGARGRGKKERRRPAKQISTFIQTLG